jgi:hypothetical protein
MNRIFKELKFTDRKELSRSNVTTTIRAFVPGVNSGVYSPPSLHIQARIDEAKAGWFKLRRTTSGGSLTLSLREFDDLFEQMERIKALRAQIQKETP